MFNKDDLRVYTMVNDQKSFKAVDTDTGQQVGNLIFASVLNKDDIEQVALFCQHLVEDNPEVIHKAQVRNLGGKVLRKYSNKKWKQ